LSEAEWVDRARRGDQAAWEDILRTHQAAAFRLAYLLLGDANDAEDVAQEAFLSAYRALDRFDTARPLRPWLMRITANLARNRRRALGRYLAALNRLLRAEPERVLNVQDLSAKQIEAQDLWRAVRRLSEADQQIVYLRYFLEMPEAETAEALGIAPGTVKSRLHRALNRLRMVVDSEFPSLRKELADG
jgi:RNA polymerase sigma-70 factor (ECF subfamily)